MTDASDELHRQPEPAQTPERQAVPPGGSSDEFGSDRDASPPSATEEPVAVDAWTGAASEASSDDGFGDFNEAAVQPAMPSAESAELAEPEPLPTEAAAMQAGNGESATGLLSQSPVACQASLKALLSALLPVNRSAAAVQGVEQRLLPLEALPLPVNGTVSWSKGPLLCWQGSPSETRFRARLGLPGLPPVVPNKASGDYLPSGVREQQLDVAGGAKPHAAVASSPDMRNDSSSSSSSSPTTIQAAQARQVQQWEVSSRATDVWQPTPAGTAAQPEAAAEQPLQAADGLQSVLLPQAASMAPSSAAQWPPVHSEQLQQPSTEGPSSRQAFLGTIAVGASADTPLQSIHAMDESAQAVQPAVTAEQAAAGGLESRAVDFAAGAPALSSISACPKQQPASADDPFATGASGAVGTWQDPFAQLPQVASTSTPETPSDDGWVNSFAVKAVEGRQAEIEAPLPELPAGAPHDAGPAAAAAALQPAHAVAEGDWGEDEFADFSAAAPVPPPEATGQRAAGGSLEGGESAAIPASDPAPSKPPAAMQAILDKMPDLNFML